MRLVLDTSPILNDLSSSESCYLIFPSKHLESRQLALLLRRNGLACKTVGRAAGTLRDAVGEHPVPDLLAIVLPHKQEKRLHQYLRLFGSKAVQLPTSRSSVG